METINKIEFISLPYSYDALEPYIDKLTVEIHYSKHHKTYYDNFINVIKNTEMESMDIADIFSNMNKYPEVVRNNSGGFYNHTLYWENMKPEGVKMPFGKLSENIIKTFGSIEEFKKQYSEAGKSRFGSGWVWLNTDDKGNLFISSTPNQDNPLMNLPDSSSGVLGKKGIPLLAMDVWEHAYYLKYQNKRADYIEAFMNIIDWEVVAKRYENAINNKF